MIDLRMRTLAEVDAATRLRAHPEQRLPPELMRAIMDAPMGPCGHLVGFEPPDHLSDAQACLAAFPPRRD